MRPIILLGLAFTFVAVTPPSVRASGLWGAEGSASWCAALRPASDHVMQAIFKAYLPAVEQQGIDLRQTRIAEAKDIFPLLSRAVQLGWGPLEFFTDREFARQGGCILLLDQKALLEIDKQYDVHGLWMIRAAVEGQKNADMEFLLLGQGKLLLGYPRQEIVHVKDYDLWTGKYTYEPFIAMDIINDGQEGKLTNIKILAKPDGEWQPFRGPLEAEIRSLEVDGDFIRVKYSKMGEMTERIRKIGISLR